jgi:DNA polymerase elongation subunit (family B)
MRGRGWLLDAYLEGGDAVLWLKTVDGRPVRLRERYRPELYAAPRRGVETEELAAMLEEHPGVYSTSVEQRYMTLRRRRLEDVVRVVVDTAEEFRAVSSGVRRLREVESLHDVDLPQIQWYLFRKGIAPSGMVEWGESGGRLEEIRVLDDAFTVEPPPFQGLIFRAVRNGPIDRISVLDDSMRPEQTFDGGEVEALSRFQEVVEDRNPDLLVAEKVKGTVRNLLDRSQASGLDLRLGRLGEEAQRGRVLLELRRFGEVGLAGLVERARFTMAPMGMCAGWPAGKTIDARQCYEAWRLGILVPESRGGHGYVSTAWDLARRDRGGLVFSPRVGLHENVGCLDFESMFPSIIVRRNISYETVGPSGVDQSAPGFLGGFTGPLLSRRLHFKHLRGKYPWDSREWLRCEQRQNELKLFLVCIYGYSGCFANRFGDVRVFQEINGIARSVLVQSLNIALNHGFEVVYGDSDSLFNKKADASRRDYEMLAAEIEEATGLPIKLDRHFRFLVLLPKASDPWMQAARRYYGKLTNGSLFYRGIELRRHDTPPFIKRFQEELMGILFDAESSKEVLEEQLPEALKFVREACMEISRGGVEPGELVISKRLTRDPDEYISKQPHVVAAELEAVEGSVVNYLFVDADHRNPYLRVMPDSMLDGGHRSYDRGKYVELVRRAAECLLRPIAADGWRERLRND